MTYSERLNHWAIVRLLPNLQRITIARFRSRSDADGHLQFLRHHLPTATFILIFDQPTAPLPNAPAPQPRKIPL